MIFIENDKASTALIPAGAIIVSEIGNISTNKGTFPVYQMRGTEFKDNENITHTDVFSKRRDDACSN